MCKNLIILTTVLLSAIHATPIAPNAQNAHRIMKREPGGEEDATNKMVKNKIHLNCQ